MPVAWSRWVLSALLFGPDHHQPRPKVEIVAQLVGGRYHASQGASREGRNASGTVFDGGSNGVSLAAVGRLRGDRTVMVVVGRGVDGRSFWVLESVGVSRFRQN